MNKLAKGKRIEREVAKALEKIGYLTYRPSWNRWGKKDVFQKFDIITILNKTSDIYPPILFLQVKSNQSDFYKARREVKEWCDNVSEKVSGVGFGVVLRERKDQYRIWMMVHVYDFLEEKGYAFEVDGLESEEWVIKEIEKV